MRWNFSTVLNIAIQQHWYIKYLHNLIQLTVTFPKGISLLPVILPIFFVPLIKLPANPETWAPRLYPIRWALLLENWTVSWNIVATWFRWRNVKSKQWNIYYKQGILWIITQEICMLMVLEWGAWIIQYISIG